MSCKNRRFMKCLGLSTALILGSVYCFSTPSTARVINNDSVSIQIGQTEKKTVINSNLLTEDGQTIFVNGDFTELVVPLTFSSDSVNVERNKMSATVKAVSSDTERLQVALDKSTVVLQEEESVVNLTMNLTDISEEPEADANKNENSGLEETPGTEETPDTEGTESGTGEVPDTEEAGPGTEETPDIGETESGTENEESTTTGIPSETESGNNFGGEIAVRVLPRIVIGTAAEDESSTENETTTDEPVTETEPDSEQETEAESVPDTEETMESESESTTDTEDKTEIETETETEPTTDVEDTTETETIETETEPTMDSEEKEKEKLSAEISLTYGEQTFSAIVVVVEDTMEESENGELAFCPSQYDSDITLTMIGGKEADCMVSGFPAMTRYILEEQSYVLYNGGNILVPAGKEVQVDFSLTKQKTDFLLTAGTDKTYTIKYAKAPEFAKESDLLIVNEDGVILPFESTWGTIKPTFTVEQLTKGEKAPEWKSIANVTAEANEEKELKIIPEQAEAGTYRVIVLWTENEVTLYRMEIPFFIQYKSVDQGGTGQ